MRGINPIPIPKKGIQSNKDNKKDDKDITDELINEDDEYLNK